MHFTLFTSNFFTGTSYTCATYLTQGLIVSAMTVLYLNRESGLFGMDALQEEDAEAENPVAEECKGEQGHPMVQYRKQSTRERFAAAKRFPGGCMSKFGRRKGQ